MRGFLLPEHGPEGRSAGLFTEAFSGTLEGTMIDFKQDEDGETTGMDPEKFRDLVVDFADKNTWSLNQLEDYYVVEKNCMPPISSCP